MWLASNSFIRAKATTKPTAAHLRHPRVVSSIPADASAGKADAQAWSRCNRMLDGRTAIQARNRAVCADSFIRNALTAVLQVVFARRYDHEICCSRFCIGTCEL